MVWNWLNKSTSVWVILVTEWDPVKKKEKSKEPCKVKRRKI